MYNADETYSYCDKKLLSLETNRGVIIIIFFRGAKLLKPVNDLQIFFGNRTRLMPF